ncbi:MAG: hypothetical protein ACK4FF_03085 [Limnobacter sp.]|uniref:hypothetical protein n=1 Tax=Limnobacter sp. TaxID=2003368 RepID=UPI00391DC40B
MRGDPGGYIAYAGRSDQDATSPLRPPVDLSTEALALRRQVRHLRAEVQRGQWSDKVAWMLAEAHRRLRQPRRCLNMLDRCGVRAQASAPVMQTRALALQALGQHDDCIRLLLAPGQAHLIENATVLHAVGVSFQALGDWPSAELFYRRAWLYDPLHWPAATALMDVLLVQGRRSEFQRVFSAFVLQFPGKHRLIQAWGRWAS